MRMNAVLSNPKHPEYGQFTVPLPIPHNQYDGIMEALNAMDMGDPLARDCQMDEILGEYPILKRLEGKPVNIDELDYLAKRLDSFCYAQEGAQFQGAAVSYDYSDMTDLINLTFSCQQVTVITDFSDLEQVGRDHYMVLNGGCASKEELDALDGYETALLLIDEGNGVITPYGVSAVMFLVIGGLAFISHYYTLDGIKSKTVGDGQHGTARWATKQEIRQTYAHIPFEPELWRKGEHLPEKQGLILGCEGPKNHVTALVDTDDIHAMVTAASGAGKTAFFLSPNIEYRH